MRDTERREARILFVTARRSLSIQTLRGLQALGFVLYSDTHTLGRGQVDLERYPRTIFQVESLPRGFSRDSKAFDCIYADEIAQTIGSPPRLNQLFLFLRVRVQRPAISGGVQHMSMHRVRWTNHKPSSVGWP